MKDYCETFHLIDKGNGAEAHYDMGGKSRTHNWLPKLVFQLWNMLMHNAYKIYSVLHKKYTHDQNCLLVKQCVKELTFNAGAEGGASRKHCQPFTNSRMDCWKEDPERRKTDATTGRDEDTGTGIILLGRVDEEAEECAVAHSYTRVEQQVGEVLLGGLPRSNHKRRGKATVWL